MYQDTGEGFGERGARCMKNISRFSFYGKKSLKGREGRVAFGRATGIRCWSLHTCAYKHRDERADARAYTRRDARAGRETQNAWNTGRAPHVSRPCDTTSGTCAWASFVLGPCPSHTYVTRRTVVAPSLASCYNSGVGEMWGRRPPSPPRPPRRVLWGPAMSAARCPLSVLASLSATFEASPSLVRIFGSFEAYLLSLPSRVWSPGPGGWSSAPR